MSVVGDNIRILRAHRGISQTDLAAAIGESKQTIYKYENGIISNIPLPKIEAIARVLNCTPESLVGWNEWSKQLEKVKPVETDGLTDKQREFIRLVSQLSDQEVSMLSAQVKGLLQSQGSQDDA